jgi:hypothetical protein
MNYYLLTYVLLCIVIGLGIIAILAQTGRGIGAVVFLVGAIMVFTFFGLRWFKYGTNPFANSMWPPIINTCPDYLVYVERTKNGKTIGACVDPLGVARSNELQKWVYSGSMNDTTAPTANNLFFDLDFNETDPVKLQKLRCEKCMNLGVTWDGVSDGETCYTQIAAAAAAAASASGCAAAAASAH